MNFSELAIQKLEQMRQMVLQFQALENDLRGTFEKIERKHAAEIKQLRNEIRQLRIDSGCESEEAASSNKSKHKDIKNDDDFDPQSNVYVSNLPGYYGKERLRTLFSKYGEIARHKFVAPDGPTQPAYGFVQFSNVMDANTAIDHLKGHSFGTFGTIQLSIALRDRHNLSAQRAEQEPTNLYVKNLPLSWTNEQLNQVFGAYGSIRQSRVVGDGVAFVRFEDNEQALNAIGYLDKLEITPGVKLEVRFATRQPTPTGKTSTSTSTTPTVNADCNYNNAHNLYIRNVPNHYTQVSLENLFSAYGQILTAKINNNGIAFVRFANATDAKRAIQELHGTKPPQFDKEIVVKLAQKDIDNSRNRCTSNAALNATAGYDHYLYQHHMNAFYGVDDNIIPHSYSDTYATEPYPQQAVIDMNEMNEMRSMQQYENYDHQQHFMP